MTLIAGVQPPDSGKGSPEHVSLQPSLLTSIFASGEDGRGQRAVLSKGLQEPSLTQPRRFPGSSGQGSWQTAIPAVLMEANMFLGTTGLSETKKQAALRGQVFLPTGYRDLGFRQ